MIYIPVGKINKQKKSNRWIVEPSPGYRTQYSCSNVSCSFIWFFVLYWINVNYSLNQITRKHVNIHYILMRTTINSAVLHFSKTRNERIERNAQRQQNNGFLLLFTVHVVITNAHEHQFLRLHFLSRLFALIGLRLHYQHAPTFRMMATMHDKIH